MTITELRDTLAQTRGPCIDPNQCGPASPGIELPRGSARCTRPLVASEHRRGGVQKANRRMSTLTQTAGFPAAKSLSGVVAGLVLWAILYSQLAPFSRVAGRRTGGAAGTRLHEAVAFFAYDTPKVLLLLVLVVFVMGVVRSFFSPEHTRRLLAGRREGAGNVLAASLGIVTPFCSCSAVPLFIGFVSAGVPLGVTFSFLIAAPMVNEVALGLLFGLVGWQVALAYLAFGLGVAIVAGWVIGRLRLEHWLEPWVRERARRAGRALQPTVHGDQRIHAGLDAVRDIVGRVWHWVILGIAVGALIHGYVPAELLATIMGTATWWSVPAVVLIGVPMYSNAAGIIPVVEALLGKGAALGHRARLHDVGDRAFAARNDHPAQGAQPPADRRVHRRRGSGHPGGGIPVQRAVRLTRCAMKDVKVLGSGCKRCIATAAMIETEAARLGVSVSRREGH